MNDRKGELYTAEFFKVTLVFFLLFVTWAMLFVLPILIEQLGGDALDVGVIMGATPISAVLSRLLLGRWMDRSGRKKILVFCALLNTAVMFLFITVRAPGWWPVALRVLMGVSYGGYFSVLFTIISDLAPEKRLAEGLGNFGIAGLLALAVGPWAAERITAAYGFSGLFVVAGLVSLAATLFSLLLAESRRPAFCETAIPAGPRVFRRSVILILLATLAFAASRSAPVSFLAGYCRERGIGSIGLYSLVYSLTTVVFRFFAGPFTDRHGSSRVLIPGLVLFGAGTALLAGLNSVGILVAAAFLGGLGHCFLYPALNALVIQRVSVCRRGTATGLFTASFDFGLGSAAWLWGPVAEAGGYPLMYALAGAAAWLGVWAAVGVNKSFD